MGSWEVFHGSVIFQSKTSYEGVQTSYLTKSSAAWAASITEASAWDPAMALQIEGRAWQLRGGAQ